MQRLDAASFPSTSSRHYISAKNIRHRSNLYTTKQFPTPPHIQVGERTKGPPESMYIRSQSLSICPIEGQNSSSRSRSIGCMNHYQRNMYDFPRQTALSPSHTPKGWFQSKKISAGLINRSTNRLQAPTGAHPRWM